MPARRAIGWSARSLYASCSDDARGRRSRTDPAARPEGAAMATATARPAPRPTRRTCRPPAHLGDRPGPGRGGVLRPARLPGADDQRPVRRRRRAAVAVGTGSTARLRVEVDVTSMTTGNRRVRRRDRRRRPVRRGAVPAGGLREHPGAVDRDRRRHRGPAHPARRDPPGRALRVVRRRARQAGRMVVRAGGTVDRAGVRAAVRRARGRQAGPAAAAARDRRRRRPHAEPRLAPRCRRGEHSLRR